MCRDCKWNIEFPQVMNCESYQNCIISWKIGSFDCPDFTKTLSIEKDVIPFFDFGKGWEINSSNDSSEFAWSIEGYPKDEGEEGYSEVGIFVDCGVEVGILGDVIGYLVVVNNIACSRKSEGCRYHWCVQRVWWWAWSAAIHLRFVEVFIPGAWFQVPGWTYNSCRLWGTMRQSWC